VFDALTLYGGGGARGPGTLVWGYRPVAVLTSWRIVKAPGAWKLSATFAQADAWQCRQAAKYQELLFTAPRDKGRWCWPLTDVNVGTTELRATLGPPLQ
jgi:hypothetical protein